MNGFYVATVLCFCILGNTTSQTGRSRINTIWTHQPGDSNFYTPFLKNGVCRIDEFQCDSQQCIPEENHCDGGIHCEDGSDENRCETIPCNTRYLFRCNYGACITQNLVCDGKSDCRDRSDEYASYCRTLKPEIQASSLCRIDQYECDLWQCIPEEDQCDGKEDCRDGSDETENCMVIPCNSRYLFQCSYGACISKKLVCDGNRDCKDGSDELPNVCNRPVTTPKYPTACGRGQFSCSSGQCLDRQLMCDGKIDCLDRSDETASLCGSLICPRFTFRCNYGACVRSSARCNGYADCADGSDEDLCAVNTPITTPSTAARSDCLIPENPANGSYVNSGNSITINGQVYANQLSILILACEDGFKHYPPEVYYSICRNRKWLPNLPVCRKLCSSLNLPTDSSIQCQYRGGVLKSCENAVQGVTVFFPCMAANNNTSEPQNCTLICNYGNWELVTRFPIANGFSLYGNQTLNFNLTIFPSLSAK